MYILFAYIYPMRQFKEIKAKILPLLENYAIEGLEWTTAPHISISLISQDISASDKQAMVKLAKNKPTFRPLGVEVLGGLHTPKAYFALKLSIPEDFKALVDKLDDTYETNPYPELKPHCSLFSVPKSETKKIENLVRDVGRDIKSLLYPTKPELVSFWKNYEIDDIYEQIMNLPEWDLKWEASVGVWAESV